MKLCVYTTNHDGFLEFARDHRSRDRPIGFFSKKRWVGAARYLEKKEAMPILMRKIEDETRPLACSYIADLVKIRFSDTFRTDAEFRNWLRKALWLQREWYVSVGSTEDFEDEEVVSGMEMETFYFVQRLAEIKPLPLSRLVKSSDGTRLSDEYRYSYSVCKVPSEIVRKT